jgi:hypothetical protein
MIKYKRVLIFNIYSRIIDLGEGYDLINDGHVAYYGMKNIGQR